MKKIFLAAIIVAATIISFCHKAEAQIINDLGNGNLEVMSKGSYDLGIGEYNLRGIEAMKGLEFDQVVYYNRSNGALEWKIESIGGLFLGARGGAAYYSGSNSGASYSTAVMVGYAWNKVSVAVTGGAVALKDYNNKNYNTFNMFVEPSFYLAKWGANNLQTGMFYAGVKVGFQQHKKLGTGNYDDSNITLDVDSKSLSASFAYGGQIGVEWRRFQKPVRIGLELSAYTFEGSNSFKFDMNGTRVADSKKTKNDVLVQLTVRLTYVFHRRCYSN